MLGCSALGMGQLKGKCVIIPFMAAKSYFILANGRFGVSEAFRFGNASFSPCPVSAFIAVRRGPMFYAMRIQCSFP